MVVCWKCEKVDINLKVWKWKRLNSGWEMENEAEYRKSCTLVVLMFVVVMTSIIPPWRSSARRWFLLLMTSFYFTFFYCTLMLCSCSVVQFVYASRLSSLADQLWSVALVEFCWPLPTWVCSCILATWANCSRLLLLTALAAGRRYTIRAISAILL